MAALQSWFRRIRLLSTHRRERQ